MVAYGVVELVMNAVVSPPVDDRRAQPGHARTHAHPVALGGREEGEKRMREHEVPTHVQAEDRVLLWFTFPQIVALLAVISLSYGAYHYVPGPSETRIALAVLLGLFGTAMVVGKIGGRRLPMVAADLLKYRLGARLYAGSPAQLARSEPPAPVESGPGPGQPDGEAGQAGYPQDAGHGAPGPPKDAQEPKAAERTDALPSPRLVRQAPRAQREENPRRQVADRPSQDGMRNEKRSRSWRSLMSAAALAALVAIIPQAAASGRGRAG